MSKFETAFKAAIAENERRILISTLLASPELTLGEIHKLSKGGLGRLFSEVTIADLLGGRGGNGGGAAPAPAAGKGRGGRRGAAASEAAAPSGGARRGRKPGPKAEAAAAEAAPAEGKGRGGRRGGGKAKAVNTRTAEGRAAYDESLFQALQESGSPTGAGALISKVGGSSLQARAGLARLIEAGRITWSGKARGTKYSVA